MKLRSVALVGIACLAVLGMVGAGAGGAFTTSTRSGQSITVGTLVGTFGGPPTVTIVYPVNGATYGTNWPGAVTGTAAVNTTATAIAKVQVSIQQVGGTCWTGSGDTWSATCPNYVAVTTGTTAWSLSIPASDLTSGDVYKVTAQATDSDGNTGTSATVTFAYDTALPTVTITYPANGANVCPCKWGGAIKGTASSNSGPGTTITGVSVSIEDTTTNRWWNGISFTSTKAFVGATGTTTWTLVLGTASLHAGDSYSVTAEATDSAGNMGNSATVNFTYCNTKSAPTVTITYPVNGATYGSNWGGSISGAASPGSSATSIKTVTVAVENLVTKLWWNGTAFSATSQGFLAATGTTTWYLPLPVSGLTNWDTYSVVAQATDSAGSTATSATVGFTYKTTSKRPCPPTVKITYPVNGAKYGSNWTGMITGAASAASGATITSASLAIEDSATKLWWNGTSFAASSQTFKTASGTTTWFLPLPVSALAPGVSYSLVGEATDNLGHTGTSATVTFTYSIPTGPPTVKVTYPVNGTKYGSNWTGMITGTASSNSGPGTTITATKVAMENTTNGKWWNGTSFKAASQTFVPVTGTTTWMIFLSASKLIPGDSYSVTAEATDSLGHTGTSARVSFTYIGGSHV